MNSIAELSNRPIAGRHGVSLQPLISRLEVQGLWSLADATFTKTSRWVVGLRRTLVMICETCTLTSTLSSNKISILC